MPRHDNHLARALVSIPLEVAPSFQRGDRVTVFRLALFRRPFIEGTATIHDCIDPAESLYRVAFDDDGGRLRDRLVYPGEWQSSPDAQLARMLTAWRTCVTPELLADLDF